MTYSAMIILGNEIDKIGKLNKESSSRMDIAIEIFHKKQVPYIITSGWAYRNDLTLTIADAMKIYAVEIGDVPSNSILTETNSRDTVGNAIFTKNNIVKKKKWNNLLVVTSDYHTVRTYEIFNYVYGKQYSIKVIGTVTNKKKERAKSEKKSLQAFHETFMTAKAGDDALIHKCLCENHPYYNGLIHPQIVI